MAWRKEFEIDDEIELYLTDKARGCHTARIRLEGTCEGKAVVAVTASKEAVQIRFISHSSKTNDKLNPKEAKHGPDNRGSE